MSSPGNSSASSSSIGSMMGGVVGPDAGWKLFNESTSLNEEGVVILVTHQTALVVRSPWIIAQIPCTCKLCFNSYFVLEVYSS